MTSASAMKAPSFLMQFVLWLSLLCAAGLSAAQQREIVVYLHPDITGSPIMATDSAGNVIWKERYAPYGERQVNADDGRNALWYTGKRQDPDTGLSYFGARWYDPALGRFAGVDPASFVETNPHSFNRYAYGNNNPFKYLDPDGQSPLSIFLIEVAKQTGAGYLAGVAADAVSQYAAFGQVDLYMAATSNAAIAGGEAGAISGSLSGAVKTWALVKASGAASVSSELSEGARVYRAWGGKSGPYGESWTTVNPNTIGDYRSVAGLPDVNEGRFVIEGVLRTAKGVTSTTARVIKPGQQGGLPEVVIKDAQHVVKVDRVSGVNPPF